MFIDKKYVLLDGAMGTMLQKKGMQLGTIPETLNITKPDWIIDIHRQYIEAGSDIVYANTFGANRHKMADTGYTVDELISSAIKNAKKAAKGTDTLVALDMGPIGQLLEPTGNLTFEEAYDIYKEQVLAGKDADVIVVETMTDLLEVKAAVLAAKENSDKPVLCTMTFETNKRTFTGCSISAMCLTLEGLGVDGIGVNCSLGPKDLIDIVKEISTWTSLPVIAKANAGLPDPVTNEYDVMPDEFAMHTYEMIKQGAVIVGGCCGTNPEYIKALRNVLDNVDESEFNLPKKVKTLSVCSPTKTVVVDQPRVVGERINPTGKKRFKQALMENDMNYILSQAIEQVEAGADILDVNVGAPDVDEKEMMIKTVKAIQGVVDVPLQIDSTKPEVLDAALRVYNGRPIVNSVNGEEEVLENILPIVAKYGAAIIGLTLDDDGIPKTCEKRLEIAEKIINRAAKYGIPKKDIIIDCLVMTVSAEQSAAKETLKAVKAVKEKFGVKTVLGCSNISFGLPNRELINKTFLAMALHSGLDLPIINPNVLSMMWAVKSYKVLADIDKNSMDYIDYAAKMPAEQTTSAGVSVKASTKASLGDEKADKILKSMETGMKVDAANVTKEILEEKDSLYVINNVLIPALDVVGEKFEKGTIFLPQLILAADVAKACFDVIKESMTDDANENQSRGKIILATVKGDIHDIGKNIVKVILENYGFDIIDLGRDVDPMLVVNTAIEQNVKLVGLSALMTTTLGSMEETINLLKEHNVDCQTMVGGAVVTEDYAKQIGATYYAKDAKQSADIAKTIFG